MNHKNSKTIQDGANDDDEFTVGGETDEGLVIQPRWPTRVFAAQCLRKIIEGLSILILFVVTHRLSTRSHGIEAKFLFIKSLWK